jgi:putative phage-type endonuclease
MPITPEQRAARKYHIGGSDMPAILGLDPFKTAYDVYLAKRGMLIEDEVEDADGADPRYVGNRLEDGVLDYAQDKLGALERNVTLAVEGAPICVNIDARVIASGEPVEAKTVGLFAKLRDGEWWGDDGTDQVPDRVIIQSHCHMLATKRGICHVPVLIGGRGLAMFAVQHNAAIEEVIRRAADAFWACVQSETPPINSHASLQVVKRLRHQPEKIISIDPAIVAAWLEAKAAAQSAKDADEDATAALLTAIGDAEAATAGEFGAVTYLEQTRNECVCKASTFRVLRHKPKGL